MTVFTSFSMLFVSYSPLWLSILFLDIKSVVEKQTRNMTEIISIIVILISYTVSFIILIVSFSIKSRRGNQEYVIQSVEEEKVISTEYLLSYILPLLAFDFTLWHQVVLFLIFFFVLAFLCIRHNYFMANVFLEIIGYRLYKCKLENEDGITITKAIISKERLLNRKTEKIRLSQINNECMLDLTKWN